MDDRASHNLDLCLDGELSSFDRRRCLCRPAGRWIPELATVTAATQLLKRRFLIQRRLATSPNRAECRSSLATVEEDGRSRDSESVTQLPNKKVTRRDVVVVYERGLTGGDARCPQQQRPHR